MKKASILLILCCFIILKGNAQKIKITASNESLNNVLIELRDSYGAEFSFNDTETAKIKVSVDKTFKSIEDALIFLLKPHSYTYDIKDDVFIIYKKTIEEYIPVVKKIKKIYRLTGQIIERNRGEALPFSVVLVNGNGITSDENGKFTYASSKDSIFVLQISHLGYFVKDTIVRSGFNKIFELTPSVQNLEEIIITDKIIETFSQTGTQAGKIKLNHQITKYLPGSSDNSVFNLLRLQPGILASGEQTNDLIIWGAYQGQSIVMFDGFTIFGLKNFNDNISAVNPFMVQHLQIHKAGFDASYGDRVGGIVEINGKNGSVNKPSIDLSISNFTVNGLIQLPVTKNSSLQIAGRKTYYQLYNAEDVPILRRIIENSENENIINNFIPDYDFKDVNVKYSLRSQKGDIFYLSFLAGKDDFSYDFERINQNTVISKITTESNFQTGSSAFYGKTWKNGLKTDLLFAYSSLNTNFSDLIKVNLLSDFRLLYQMDSYTLNMTEEYKARFKNSFPINRKHTIESGIAYIRNSSSIKADTFDINYLDQKVRGDHISIFAQDKFSFNNSMLTYGGRINYLPYLNAFYFEPRISLSADLSDNFRLNTSWGLYKQFVSKSSVTDELGNYRYIWTVADNVEIPVLESSHFVNGISFHKGGFQLNLETYFKRTQGITRYVKEFGNLSEDVYVGRSQSIGADLFIKQNFKGHTAWLSYSLGRTTELFEYHVVKLFRTAPHHQTHELKLAGMIDLDPFYLSANYVFGSGFTIFTGNLQHPVFETDPYNRLDAAFTYRFSVKRNSVKRFYGEIGISILNVLNTDNLKYSNFERIPADQTNTIDIYNESVPFSPCLYLKIGF